MRECRLCRLTPELSRPAAGEPGERAKWNCGSFKTKSRSGFGLNDLLGRHATRPQAANHRLAESRLNRARSENAAVKRQGSASLMAGRMPRGTASAPRAEAGTNRDQPELIATKQLSGGGRVASANKAHAKAKAFSGLTPELSRPAATAAGRARKVELRVIQGEAAKRVRLE
jgi:hypothetical protein